MTTPNIRMVAMYTHKCLKCGFEWESAQEKPKTCKRCKCYSFNQRKKERGWKEKVTP